MSKNRFDALSPAQRISDGEAQATQTASAGQNTDSSDKSKSIGKRSDPKFRQVTAYIPRDVYKQVTIKLTAEEPKGEFSELVAQLLTKWLNQSNI